MSSKSERNQVSRLFRCWEFYRALSTAFFSILQSYEPPPSSLPSPPRQAVQIDGTHLIIWHSCLLGGDTQWSLSWLMFLKRQGHVFSTGTGTEGGQDGAHGGQIIPTQRTTYSPNLTHMNWSSESSGDWLRSHNQEEEESRWESRPHCSAIPPWPVQGEVALTPQKSTPHCLAHPTQIQRRKLKY